MPTATSPHPAPAIAVVIPAHRPAAFTRAALDSVAAQTRPPVAVQVVADTPELAIAALPGRLVPAGVPVQACYQEAGPGPARSRNLGAQLTTAPWLAFLDDDDQWRPDFLARVAAILARREADIVAGGVCRAWPDGRVTPYRRLPATIRAAAVAGENPGITGSNLVVARQLFDALGGFDADLPVAEDRDFLMRALWAGARVQPTGAWDVLWWQHGGARLSPPFSAVQRHGGGRAFQAKHRRHLPWRRRLYLAGRLAAREYAAARTWRQRARLAAAVLLSGSRTNLRLLRQAETMAR